MSSNAITSLLCALIPARFKSSGRTSNNSLKYKNKVSIALSWCWAYSSRPACSCQWLIRVNVRNHFLSGWNEEVSHEYTNTALHILCVLFCVVTTEKSNSSIYFCWLPSLILSQRMQIMLFNQDKERLLTVPVIIAKIYQSYFLQSALKPGSWHSS